MQNALPANRVWLSHTITEPTFDDAGDTLFYLRAGDGRRSLIRHDLATGLQEIVTADPSPGGNVGYGGGAYAIAGALLVYAAAGRLVALDLKTGAQRMLTVQYEGVASPVLSPCGRFVAFVIENDGHADVVLADTTGAAFPIKLSASPAFAANPTFSPDGTRIAWMEWEHNRMPWEQSLLRIARFSEPVAAASSPGALLPLVVATLGEPNVSFASPQWSPDGAFFAYTSDASGWRSVYVASSDGQGGTRVDTGRGEIGSPDWIQGQFAVRWGQDHALYAVRRYRSRADLVRVTFPEHKLEALTSQWRTFGELAVHPNAPDLLAYVASSSVSSPVLVTRRAEREIICASTAVGLVDREALARSEIIEWPTVDQTMVYGLLYTARIGVGPRPLLVVIHGGPTSEAADGWNAQAQYFAGKGWHCLLVNHRGGTGSGRAYQDLLNGTWGVFDVEDARTGAQHLIEQGLADAARIAITGGSAGGFTTLSALASDPEFWTAGVSLFGIGNLYETRLGSHRFEARYEDSLIGPLPDTAALWIDRSPLSSVDRVRAPLLLFHGKEDTAVPYQQSTEFADALRARGRVAELVLYDDEGHGFRKEQNRKDQLQRMDAFLEKYVVNLQGRMTGQD